MLGSEVLVDVDVGARRPSSDVAGPPPSGIGGDGTRITGRFDRGMSALAGGAVTVRLDPAQLDFFDSESGEAVARDGAA